MLRTGTQQVVGQSDPAAAEQATVASTSPLDEEIVSGDDISQIVGVRIATPIFGTGFNFCVGMATLSLHVWPTGGCLHGVLCLLSCVPSSHDSPPHTLIL